MVALWGEHDVKPLAVSLEDLRSGKYSFRDYSPTAKVYLDVGGKRIVLDVLEGKSP